MAAGTSHSSSAAWTATVGARYIVPSSQRTILARVFLPATSHESPITFLIDHAAERSQRLARQRIPRFDFQRFLEATLRVAVHLFA